MSSTNDALQARLRADGELVIRRAVAAVLPDEAVRRALENVHFPGRVFLVAVGKAAWQMANAALTCLGKVERGIVITKYGHLGAPLEGIDCYEGAHPVPDENGVRAAEAVLRMSDGLSASDTVLFLLSGGGSALFEKPLLALEEVQSITAQLLAAGADIVEMNTVRKRLSAVKGGRFALHCAPARVFAVMLSDIVGGGEDMIASGPVCADASTCAQAISVAEKYRLDLSQRAWELLRVETPKSLDNVTTVVTGSVRELCAAAERECRALGYEPILLTDRLCCEARDAGSFLASVARTHAGDGRDLAFLAGGETVVHIRGGGMGGRNQELALAAALGIGGVENVLIFSLGSDGTDGPTDAAGGIVTGCSADAMRRGGVSPERALEANDSYHALEAADSLLRTGPTGTNVNDLTCLLIRGSALV